MYVGRSYSQGSTDNYGLIRDYYQAEYGVSLTNWGRPEGWWVTGQNLFLEGMKEDGFRPLDIPVYEVKEGDCLLVAVMSTVPNHVGLHIGKGKILHHLPGRLSTIDPLQGMFRDKLCAILRHPDVKVQPVVRTVDILDLMSPANRQKFEGIIQGSNEGRGS